MGSPKYEITTHCPYANWMGEKPTSNTRQQYITIAIRYAGWGRENYGSKTFAEFGRPEHIQEYVYYLERQGRRATTIHTYLAALCFVFSYPMEMFIHPRRITADFVRSRGPKDWEAERKKCPKLYDFAKKVGIRSTEYLRLKGVHFAADESGYPCVHVEKGKGGKEQFQRILPDDVEFVESYFDGSENYVFSRAEMASSIDLHRLRAELAKRAYQYYLNCLAADPDYWITLEKEIKARWDRFRCTDPAKAHLYRWDDSLIRGMYRIRGKNRERALALGLPTEFDKLAVLAVAIFFQSHWRHNTTIHNYLLVC